MKKVFTYLIISLFSITVLFSFVNAQQTRNFRGPVISPVNAILDANRGDNLNGTIRFTNDLQQDFTLNIDVTKQDFKLTQDYIIDETPKYPPNASLSSWITLGKTKISVKRGESADIPYSIKIPITADYGGHYATIAFETNKSENEQIAVQARLQFPILLNVNGNRIEKLDIDSFKADNSFYEDANVNFTTLVRNLGNVHLSPTGNIKISGGLIGGGTELKFNPDYQTNSGYVLPDKDVTRKYINEWKDSNIKFGQYTATLTMYYDTLNGQSSVTSSIQFWIIPWKLILEILGGIILLVIIIILVKKVKSKKRKKVDS